MMADTGAFLGLTQERTFGDVARDCVFRVRGGGTYYGPLAILDGSRTISSADEAGRVIDTFRLFAQPSGDLSAATIRRAIESVKSVLGLAGSAAPHPVYLEEQLNGEENRRRAIVHGGTVSLEDGIPDWSLSRGAAEIIVAIERDEIWDQQVAFRVGGDAYRNMCTPGSGDTINRWRRLLKSGDAVGGNRQGVPQVIRVNPLGATLTSATIGFKPALNENSAYFDPRINLASGVVGQSAGIEGASNTSYVSGTNYWGAKAVRIDFTEEESFRVRAAAPYSLWSASSTPENYAAFIGRYRLMARVRWSDAMGINLRAGLAYGVYVAGRAGISWLDDIYRVKDDAGIEVMDFGEIVLSGGPVGSRDMLERVNPLIVLGAGQISGSGNVVVEDFRLVPADNYVRVSWPGGVSGAYHFDILCGHDGQPQVYTCNRTHPPRGPRSLKYSGGGLWSQVLEVDVSEDGLFTPWQNNSYMVVVANSEVSVEMENIIRVAV